jgi:exopolysaccharide biosynthesis protein
MYIPSKTSHYARQFILPGILFVVICILALVTFIVNREAQQLDTSLTNVRAQANQLTSQRNALEESLASTSAALNELALQDQRLINLELEEELKNIQKTYVQAVGAYEDLLKLKDMGAKTVSIDQDFAQVLTYLSERNFASGSSVLTKLEGEIALMQKQLAPQPTIPASVPVVNAPPSSGYQRSQVQTSIGNYLVSIVSADMNSTRVIVDTAYESTCTNDCPVLLLGDYVSRNGGFAGINGSYFCPASYPSCAGKTNSFDTLLMNKNKVYFNSDNNVYSSVPAVIFSGNSARFVGRSSDWGRDTGIDSMIANQPLLVSGGAVVFGGDGDPKKGSRGNRSFVGATGSNVYIGVVHSATVAETAIVLKDMGIQNALNLDSGGSTALWSGGYKVGPGRAIPNAIVFVGK